MQSTLCGFLFWDWVVELPWLVMSAEGLAPALGCPHLPVACAITLLPPRAWFCPTSAATVSDRQGGRTWNIWIWNIVWEKAGLNPCDREAPIYRNFILSIEETIVSLELRFWGWKGGFLVVFFSRANACSFIGNLLILFLTCKSTCLPRRFSPFLNYCNGANEKYCLYPKAFSLGWDSLHPVLSRQQSVIPTAGPVLWRTETARWEILYPC